jgi:hypothetical protein
VIEGVLAEAEVEGVLADADPEVEGVLAEGETEGVLAEGETDGVLAEGETDGVLAEGETDGVLADAETVADWVWDIAIAIKFMRTKETNKSLFILKGGKCDKKQEGRGGNRAMFF